MEIPLDVQVQCADGAGWQEVGRSQTVLINPLSDQVTHVVVKANAFPHTQLLVPIEVVSETSPEAIWLRCSKSDLGQMPAFIKTTFIEEKIPAQNFVYAGTSMGSGLRAGLGTYYLPYVTSETIRHTLVEQKQIPPGELAVQRGTRVEATDGFIGKVDEFVVDPQTGHITHMVMREGHLWGKKELIIPLSALGETRGDTVFLKLNKNQVKLLPAFALHRRWS